MDMHGTTASIFEFKNAKSMNMNNSRSINPAKIKAQVSSRYIAISDSAVAHRPYLAKATLHWEELAVSAGLQLVLHNAR